jgi:hypothetical protein
MELELLLELIRLIAKRKQTLIKLGLSKSYEYKIRKKQLKLLVDELTFYVMVRVSREMDKLLKEKIELYLENELKIK